MSREGLVEESFAEGPFCEVAGWAFLHPLALRSDVWLLETVQASTARVVSAPSLLCTFSLSPAVSGWHKRNNPSTAMHVCVRLHGRARPFYCRCSAQNAALCKSPPSLRLTVLSISRASWTRSRTHAFVSRAGKTNAPVAGLQDFPSFIIADAQSETDVNFATAPPRYYLYRLIWRVAWSSAQLDKPRKKPDSRVAPCKLCSS